MAEALRQQPGITAGPDNRPRVQPGKGSGLVESYFIRANDPQRRRAIWIKATVLVPSDQSRAAVAEAWCVLFDGETGRTWAHRETVPLPSARFAEAGAVEVELAGCTFCIGPVGGSTGELANRQGRCTWDLSWQAPASPLGSPLILYPSRVLVDAAFPKFKLVTPQPLLQVQGTIRIDDELIDVSSWIGVQGHNWGREYAWEYAWGQCTFVDADGDPLCMVEGFSGRVRLAASLVTPMISALVVRRGTREYRFDRLYDTWRQRAEIGDLSWSVRLRGSDGSAQLTLRADPSQVVCLGYENPNGRMSYCINSKLAWACLRVNPVNEDGFECVSEHCGALELLQRQPDARFPVV